MSEGDGLTSTEAASRLEKYGPNTIASTTHHSAVQLLIRQFGSPIVLLLIGAAILSLLLQDSTDGAIILGIVVVSGLLGFYQEFKAGNTVAALLARVEPRATVIRDGQSTEVPLDNIVPGDVVALAGGSAIPADCRLLVSRDLFVDEAALTGEPYPVEKFEGDLPVATPLARRTNSVFMGTHAVSGTARALVMRTGASTEFGAIAARVSGRDVETEFNRGVRRFGYFLVEVTLLLVITIFAFNVYLHKPVLESFMFALALAVGLTPQLLPAIVSVNLASGAKRMAERRVIVKRLTSIENFGSMNVLCSDKTGTLTEGRVRLQSAVDLSGKDCDNVWFHAYLNATYETGYANPIDTAIRETRSFDLDGWSRLDEIPYDFVRRRLTVLATNGARVVMISKGALHSMVDVCTDAAIGGRPVPIADVAQQIRELQTSLENRGFRTLGIATREMPSSARQVQRDDEQRMLLLGLLVLCDPPKQDADRAVRSLAGLGVSFKMITGDSATVAAAVARQVGIADPVVMTSAELTATTDAALPIRAARTDVFAELEPGEKERIIRALRRGGYVVGYMGDGINDAPAFRAADVSISVQQAADVARAAADIVLLEQDLAVLEAGVREGRRTFANTLKYVFMATSANFGNMFSMAGASVFLSFLPLLPKQILLLNVLTDIPELTIATDRVDAEWIQRPRRWDVRFIRDFMLLFGVLSSVFDYATFGVLLAWLHASPEQFRTGWFVESVVSAAIVVLVIRTRRTVVAAPPSAPLAIATVCVVLAALAFPYTAAGHLFGLTPLPWTFVAAMGAIVAAYIAAAETAKRRFYHARTD